MNPLNLLPHEARAARDGSLGMLWRPVVPQPVELGSSFCWPTAEESGLKAQWASGIAEPLSMVRWCPLGPPGTLLWGREAWGSPVDPATSKLLWKPDGNTYEVVYRVDDPDRLAFLDDGDGGIAYRKDGTTKSPWRSAATMPRWASRTTLRVVSVVVKRVGEVTEDEALISAADTWSQRIALGSDYLEEFWCRMSVDVARRLGEPQPYAATTQGAFAAAWERSFGKRYPWPSAWAWGVRVERVGGES